MKIGALTRHADILSSSDIARLLPLLTEAMAHVAHPAIRNRGTIGGNLSHADPASEMPACMMALDAVIIVRSADGERRVPAADFFTGIYETVLTPDELLVGIEIPLPRAGATHFFQEYSRRKGDYAIVGLAASAVLADGNFSVLTLSYFAVGDRPQIVRASQHLIGKPITPADMAAALAALDDELDPQEDQQATAGMRKHLARQLLSLCVARLLGRPELEIRKTA
jgi:carbon-monoxide dehydrogenase medium subunit